MEMEVTVIFWRNQMRETEVVKRQNGLRIALHLVSRFWDIEYIGLFCGNILGKFSKGPAQFSGELLFWDCQKFIDVDLELKDRFLSAIYGGRGQEEADVNWRGPCTGDLLALRVMVGVLSLRTRLQSVRSRNKLPLKQPEMMIGSLVTCWWAQTFLSSKRSDTKFILVWNDALACHHSSLVWTTGVRSRLARSASLCLSVLGCRPWQIGLDKDDYRSHLQAPSDVWFIRSALCCPAEFSKHFVSVPQVTETQGSTEDLYHRENHSNRMDVRMEKGISLKMILETMR